MKKLFLFTIVLLLASSCTCLIAQIPPQYIEVDTNCQAILPDYTTDEYIIVEDNCTLKSVTQTPGAGYVLTEPNQSVEVKIRATDMGDNFTEISFLVTAKDTKPPTITPTEKFLTDNWEVINNMYDVADRLVAEQEQYFDENFNWEASGIPIEKRPIAQYDKKVLNIITSPGHATTGYGSRVITFLSNNDSYIVK